MGNPFVGIYKFFIRTFAFVSKEMIEVLRQTPLILTLVLGPFLIMLLFGLGYRNEARPLRTLVVMQKDDPLQTLVNDQVKALPLTLIYEGTISNREDALSQLRQGRVDIVVEF